MPIQEIGKNLKASLAGAAGAVKKKVKDMDAAELKASIKSGAEMIKGKAVEAGSRAAEQVKEFVRREETPETQNAADLSVIPTGSALKIIYYLMTADGEILHDEEEKFDAIGKELDPEFEPSKDALVRECRASLDFSAGAEDHAKALRSGIDRAAAAPRKPEDSCIPAKLLVWDLLAVAYSDDSYHDAERQFIDYVVERFSVDRSIYLEMRSSILTMLDLEKELMWIKRTDRPYLTIEALVKEIENRKAGIMESVMALISL